ncbi:unnamed protein product [Peniophora sp. CBMAI 1063]|nr:unnamed protein product [Peniophora sp. CBMAI 1063]
MSSPFPENPFSEPSAISEEQFTTVKNYCSHLANSMSLTPSQLNDLLINVNITRQMDHQFSSGPMMWNVLQTSLLMQMRNHQVKEGIDIVAINELAKNANKLVKEHFTLDAKQNKILISRAKEVSIQAGRTVYMTTHIDLERNVETLDAFSEIAGDEVAEGVLRSACSEKAKNARGQLRIDIYKTMVGASRTHLAKATVMVVSKYGGRLIKDLTQIPLSYQVQLALLRRFTFEEQWGDWVEKVIHEETGEEITRKRTRGSGKTIKGEDYWSLCDAWFVKLIEKFGGRDFNSEPWQKYIKETIMRDLELFGSGTDPSVEDLGAEYAPTEEEEAPSPAPTASSSGSSSASSSSSGASSSGASGMLAGFSFSIARRASFDFELDRDERLCSGADCSFCTEVVAFPSSTPPFGGTFRGVRS